MSGFDRGRRVRRIACRGRNGFVFLFRFFEGEEVDHRSPRVASSSKREGEKNTREKAELKRVTFGWTRCRGPAGRKDRAPEGALSIELNGSGRIEGNGTANREKRREEESTG